MLGIVESRCPSSTWNVKADISGVQSQPFVDSKFVDSKFSWNYMNSYVNKSINLWTIGYDSSLKVWYNSVPKPYGPRVFCEGREYF